MIVTMVLTKIENNARQVLERQKRGTLKALGKAGGYVAKAAKNSIRRSKNPSQPGRPPHTRMGRLKRLIQYAVDSDAVTAVVGARRGFAAAIWWIHEHGGTATKKLKALKPHIFRAGEFGPVRAIETMGRGYSAAGTLEDKGVAKVRFARVLLRSANQARRATRLLAAENARRRAAMRKEARYPARPFMAPALERSQEKLAEFWQDSLSA